MSSFHSISDEFFINVKKESCPVVKYSRYEMPYTNKTPQNIKYFKDFNFTIKHPPCKTAESH